MLKKSLAVIVILSIITCMFPTTVFADPSGNFYSGTWWDDRQGYRFSIFDKTSGTTVYCVDYLRESSYNYFVNDQAKGYDFYMASGNKLEYLYLYEQGYNIHEVAQNIIYASEMRFPYEMRCYSSNGTEDSNKFHNALWPIFSDSIGDGVYTWTAPQNMRLFLSEGVDGSYVEDLLNQMGFSMVGDPEYEYFGEEYVMVVEPLFWFFNRTTGYVVDSRYYGSDGFFLYGTATEWALFDQYYLDTMGSDYFYNSATGPGAHSIHYTMGLLTYLAGPASTLIEKEREITVCDDIVIEIDTSDSNINDLYDYQGQTKDAAWHEGVNRKILLSYGAEFVTPRDLTELNIDIVNDNTLFRTNSTGMLSFFAESSGELEYLPEYGELAVDPNAYGIKLVLETEPGSDLSLGTMEILSYGLPANEEMPVPVSTYIFDEFDTPSREGTWTFRLKAYRSDGNQLEYTSTNGSMVDDGEYTFTVRFMDIPTEYPADALADDKKPQDFEVVDFDPASNPYTSAQSPVTHTEWHYYDAVPFEDTTSGETHVLTFLREETADANMQGVYLPKMYNNVATAKIKDGEYYTRAGYGIGVELTKDDALSVGAQDFEAGIVLFPEYGYHDYACKLERDGDDLVMEMNPYSMYYGDVLYSDYSRVHFTPVWYPDGEYKILVFLYEYWTPAGMLWDYAEYTVHINGTVYDDWYITRN